MPKIVAPDWGRTAKRKRWQVIALKQLGLQQNIPGEDIRSSDGRNNCTFLPLCPSGVKNPLESPEDFRLSSIPKAGGDFQIQKVHDIDMSRTLVNIPIWGKRSSTPSVCHWTLGWYFYQGNVVLWAQLRDKGETRQQVSAVHRHISGVQQDVVLALDSSVQSEIIKKEGDQLHHTVC